MTQTPHFLLRLNPRTLQQEHGLQVAVFRKKIYVQWKAFDLLDKMRYILWAVVLLEARDVAKRMRSRHLGRHLGFYQELEIR